MTELSIGIDFGTTKTLVSFYNETTGRAEPIRLGRGTDYMPTSIYAAEEGGFLFGEDANDQIEFGGDRFCRAFKMKLGSNTPALVVFDGNSFIEYSAKELTRLFLQHVKARCEEEVFMGRKITGAVITKPVLFSPAQCEELKEAAIGAGFHHVEFVTEPEAAGYAFCVMCPSEAFRGNALVIDWGGGTLDMALVSRKGDQVTTHREYTAGDMEIGGELFDEKLWDHVNRRLQEQAEIDLRDEKEAHQSLQLRKVRQVKEKLSAQMQCPLWLSSSRGPCPRISLERSEFEGLIRSHVEQAAGMAMQLMGSIRGNSMKPEILLLVGGSSKIPVIASTMEQATGLPCKPWHLSQEAVSLGAAIFAGISRNLPDNQPEKDSKTYAFKEQEKTLVLTDWEMTWGCEKEVTIHGQQFKVRVPPGVVSGTKLSLPDSEIQWGGDIQLDIVLQESDPTIEKPFYIQGLEYLHGINGYPCDPIKAAEHFAQGYQQGDLNAAYMLCYCYQEGIGVPICPEFVLRCAHALIEQHYFPAYLFLSEASRTGRSVPMDLQKAEEFAAELERTCSQPLEGVNEILRVDSLLQNQIQLLDNEAFDLRKFESLARFNASISNLPTRHGCLAYALYPAVEMSPSARQELRQLLDDGCAEGDPCSCHLKGLLLCSEDSSIYIPDKPLGLELLHRASFHASTFIFEYAIKVDDPNQREQIMERFWKTCRLGPSGLHGKNELNCSIRIERSQLCCRWRVYEKGIADALAGQEGGFDQLAPLLCNPKLILRNENSQALHNLKVRICSSDVQLDETIEFPSSLSPGEELRIDPDAYENLLLGTKLYVEVQSGIRCSRMLLGNTSGLDYFRHDVPPLSMWWEIGVFGGYVLKMSCREGSISNVIVYKKEGAKTDPICLIAGQEPASVGWMEFDDSQSLKKNELFWIVSEQYPPVLGQIL